VNIPSVQPCPLHHLSALNTHRSASIPSSQSPEPACSDTAFKRNPLPTSSTTTSTKTSTSRQPPPQSTSKTVGAFFENRNRRSLLQTPHQIQVPVASNLIARTMCYIQYTLHSCNHWIPQPQKGNGPILRICKTAEELRLGSPCPDHQREHKVVIRSQGMCPKCLRKMCFQ
jgi:hypothetical protein